MQGPRSDEALRGLDGYEQMVDNFAEQAKAYWRLWGPLGEPMVRICSGCAKFMEQGDSPNLALHRGCFLHGALVEGPAAWVGKSTPFPGRHLMPTASGPV
jgi:hypothetical protein